MDHFLYRDGRLHAEDVDLAEVAAEIGTPFYCYSTATLTRHFELFDSALDWGPHLVCFAVKSCSNVAILRVLARLGAGMDVVSGGEYRRARAAGVPGERIVFSGVGKTREEMRQALEGGVRQINVESEPELAALSEVAASMAATAPIALRVNPDDSIDLIVGGRDDADREPLSGLDAGFGHFFNGYMWAMGVHDGWLYCGTYDWAMTLRWAKMDKAPAKVQKLMSLVGIEDIIAADGGADLWRTADGENWMPVDRRGFGNEYNWGVRNIVSTPAGLMVGTANVFGPKVAVPDGDGWRYEDNPDGGLEVWQGVSAVRG